MRPRYILTIFLSYILFFPLASQETRILNSNNIICKNKDYQFRVEGSFYFSGKKVYVCPKNIPMLNVTIVNSSTQTPVNSMFTWKINGSLTSETSHTLNLSNSSFNGDKSEIEAEFIETSTGNIIKMDLKLYRNIELSFTESSKMYQFDDNNKQDYIQHVAYGENLGTPWNFIENGNFDILKAEVTKKKGYYAVNNILSSNASLNINPGNMSMTPENLTLDFTGTGQNVIEVRGCHEIDPELLIYTESRKTHNIYFIQVCDTDDDIPMYCDSNRSLQKGCNIPIMSPDFVCIDGGADKTIDEMLKKSSKIPSLREIEAEGDILAEIGDTYYVLAGANLRCDYDVNKASPPDCPKSFNVINSLNAANNVLNKVAIEFLNAGTTTLNFNYNIYSEDGKMDKKEQGWLHDQRNGSNPSIDIEVYLVNDLGIGRTGIGQVQGRATTKEVNGNIVGFRTMAIDVKDASTENHVLVHELGHAIWSLQHPGAPLSGQFGIDDLNNFMHGVSNKIKNWNVRRYQFHEMHK